MHGFGSVEELAELANGRNGWRGVGVHLPGTSV